MLKELESACGYDGLYYLGLIALEQNKVDIAKTCLQKAGNGEVVEACFELGKIYQNEKKQIDTIRWYRKAAQKGHKGAQEALKKMGKTW